MYIPWREIFHTLALFAPSKPRMFLWQTGENLKISSNVKYIQKNRKRVLKKLKQKAKNEKLTVAFLIHDETKWKCQSIYDLMEKSDNYTPCIFVSKIEAPKGNMNCQKPSGLHKVYDFFKSKNMRVFYAYDFKKNEYIPFENMQPKPDIIFYQNPWYIYTTQGPVVCSKFALTYYVPYFVATSVSPIEYHLRFHQYVQTHYVLNELIKEHFSSKMMNKGKNLKVAGHPMLDYFYLNKDKNYEKKDYVIYAPHWSFDANNKLRWGSFLWSGDFMLEYAKAHPDINWIFKPHPCLKAHLKLKNILDESRINDYWNEWAKISRVYESGDYLDLFMESKAMITDCGSFQTEYFMTQKPCIYLKSANGTPFNPSVQKITDSYYNVKNCEELKKTLDEVLLNNNDYLKEKRKEVFIQCGYRDNFAAYNIMKDLEETLGI